MPRDLEHESNIGWTDILTWREASSLITTSLYKQRVLALLLTAWIAVWWAVWNHYLKMKYDISYRILNSSSRDSYHVPDLSSDDVFLIWVFWAMESVK